MPVQQQQGVELPTRWPLVMEPENRDSTTNKDAKLVNAYVEKKSDNEYQIYKRPGTAELATVGTGTGRGIFAWAPPGGTLAYYSIVGTTFYKNTTSKGTVDGTASYKFSSTLGTTPKLCFNNGVKGYTYDDSGGLVNINDANYPSATVKGFAYLDGTLYCLTAACSLQNCVGLNTPNTWTPLQRIVPQIESDASVAIGRQLTYVIAFKQWSTEFFYDAANATGSPLGAVQSAKINWGCASQDSMAELDGELFWLATNKSGMLVVMQLKGMAPLKVSSPAVERLLKGLSLTTIYAWTHKGDGHRFYVLTSVTSNLTLAYDVDQQHWQQWTDASGNYLPFVGAAYATSTTILLHESDGKAYTLDSTYTNDAGTVFPVDIITPNVDGGTRITKRMPWIEIVGDRTEGSILQVRCNDFDYDPAKWTNFRKIDLGQKRAISEGWGSFRRRAFHFRHQSNTPFRISSAEIMLMLGTN